MLDYILPIPSSPTHRIVDGSKLKRFMECPRAFFYEYLLGWRSERPNNHLVFGTAFHEALEHILLNGYTRAIADDAFEKFLTSYRTVFEPHTDELLRQRLLSVPIRPCVSMQTSTKKMLRLMRFSSPR